MTPSIPGLQYVPDYLDRETHDRLIEAVDQQQWLMSVDHRVQIYGYSYNRAKDAALRIGDLPPWTTGIGRRLCEDGLLPHVPDQLVVNDYQPGAGIFAHTDQAVLGHVIASLTLGSTCVMRFGHGVSGRYEELLLEPRSVLVLAGEARWDWQHEIPARTADFWEGRERPRSRRVSLTFRVMPRAEGRAAPRLTLARPGD